MTTSTFTLADLSPKAPLRHQRIFARALLVAMLLHGMLLLLMQLWPREEVMQIPVRSLSITLGEGEAFQKPVPAPPQLSLPAPTAIEVPAPPAPAPKASPRSESFKPAPKAPAPPEAKPAAARATETNSKPKRVPISDRRAPTLQIHSEPQAIAAPVLAVTARPAPVLPTPPAPAALPKPAPAAQRAAPVSTAAPTEKLTLTNPVQYVRSSSLPQNAAAKASASPSASEAQTIRARYEQQISAWLERHRVSPEAARALGQHGTAIMRVRIDRSGKVQYYGVDRSSGFQLIDEAAMQMVRRANPFPTAPAGYPGSDLMEFLIPVKFGLQ